MRSIVVVSPYEAEYGPRRTFEQVARAVLLADSSPVCVVRSETAISPQLAALARDVRIVPNLRTVPRTLDPTSIARFVQAHRAATAAIAAIARDTDAAGVYTTSEAVLAAGMAAKSIGLPSVTHVIGMSVGSRRFLARPYLRILDRVSTRFVACSTAAADMLATNGVARATIDLVHNSIPLAEIDAAAGLPTPISPSGPVVGMIAAYDPRKGQDIFVEAAAIVAASDPSARFVLIGGALDTQPGSVAFEAAVRRQIAELGLSRRVMQTGFVGQPAVYAWMRALDIVVAPSRTEGFAHTVLEAMACSKPVVATAIEGNLDAIVHDESGLLVDPRPAAIAAGIASLLADPRRAEALGRAARARVAERFDETVAIPRLARVVAAMIGADHGAGRADLALERH
jgi:glycosyltransferase involved in cell wall biosynthesis